MQRFVLLAIMGLCLATYATADDYKLGERVDGDVLAATRHLFRSAIPGVPVITTTGYSGKDIINAVTAVNAPGSTATIRVLNGGVGVNYITVQAVGEVGGGIDMELNIWTSSG